MPPPERTSARDFRRWISDFTKCPPYPASYIHLRQWKHSMKFDPNAYGPAVAALLALDGNGERLMPLAAGRCSSPEALAKIQALTPATLFPGARAPEAALSGLYLYFSCIDQAHEV